MIRLSSVNCSDKRMDILDKLRMLDTPTNKYEVNCNTCLFPKIDKTPNPYYISKNRNLSGIEVCIADLGNLFISERLKQIFEILLPNQCTYQRTFIQDSTILTNWWLAIPKNLVVTGEVKSSVKRCIACNEPLHAHPGSQYEFWIEDLKSDYDIVKSKNWHCVDEKDWKNSWLSRDTLISVRLINLLKKIKANGIYQYSVSKYKIQTKEEKEWVQNSIHKIGKLSEKPVFEITVEIVEKFKLKTGVSNINTKLIKEFETKHKLKSNEVLDVIINIKDGTKIELDEDNYYKVGQVKEWYTTKTKPKLIAFAFDKYGNELLFDPKTKECKVYNLDHETMIYEQVFESIFLI